MRSQNRPLGNQFDRTRQYRYQPGPSALAHQHTSNVNGSQTIRRRMPGVLEMGQQQNTITRRPPGVLEMGRQRQQNQLPAGPSIFDSNFGQEPQMIQRQMPGVLSVMPQPASTSPIIDVAAGVQTGSVNEPLNRLYGYARARNGLVGTAQYPASALSPSPMLARYEPEGGGLPAGAEIAAPVSALSPAPVPADPAEIVLSTTHTDAYKRSRGYSPDVTAEEMFADQRAKAEQAFNERQADDNFNRQLGLRRSEYDRNLADVQRQGALLDAAHRDPATAVADGHQMAANNAHQFGAIGGANQMQRFGPGGVFGDAQPMGEHDYVSGFGAGARVIPVAPREGWEDSQEVLRRNYTSDGKPGPDGIHVVQRDDGSYAATSQGINRGVAQRMPGHDGVMRFKEDLQGGPREGENSLFVANPRNFESAGSVVIDAYGNELFPASTSDGLHAWVDAEGTPTTPVGSISSHTAPENRAAAAYALRRRASWRHARGGLGGRQIQRIRRAQITRDRAVHQGVLSQMAAERRMREMRELEQLRADNRGVIPRMPPQNAGARNRDDFENRGRRTITSPTGERIRIPHQFRDQDVTAAQQDYEQMMSGRDMVSVASQTMIRSTGLDEVESLPDFYQAFGTEDMQNTLTDDSESSHLFLQAAFRRLRALYLSDPAGHDANFGSDPRHVELFRDIAELDHSDPEAVQEWMRAYLQRNIEHVHQPSIFGHPATSAQSVYGM